jgi:hypothetical protein
MLFHIFDFFAIFRHCRYATPADAPLLAARHADARLPPLLLPLLPATLCRHPRRLSMIVDMLILIFELD